MNDECFLGNYKDLVINSHKTATKTFKIEGAWKKAGLEKCTLLILQNSYICVLKGLGLIIQDYTGKKQTNIATKELLIRLYETEINSGKKDILLKLMEAEGKNVLASQIKNGKTIQHEIMSEGYNISFLDIILLFLHLKIPLIIYSKNKVKLFNNKKAMVIGDGPKEEMYIMKIKNTRSSGGRNGGSKIFGILQYNNSIKINLNVLGKAKAELIKEDPIKNINDYRALELNYLIAHGKI